MRVSTYYARSRSRACTMTTETRWWGRHRQFAGLGAGGRRRFPSVQRQPWLLVVGRRDVIANGLRFHEGSLTRVDRKFNPPERERGGW